MQKQCSYVVILWNRRNNPKLGPLYGVYESSTSIISSVPSQLTCLTVRVIPKNSRGVSRHCTLKHSVSQKHRPRQHLLSSVHLPSGASISIPPTLRAPRRRQYRKKSHVAREEGISEASTQTTPTQLIAYQL